MASYKRLPDPKPTPPPPTWEVRLTLEDVVALRVAIFRAHRATGPGRGAGDDSWASEEGREGRWRDLYSMLHEMTSGKRGNLLP